MQWERIKADIKTQAKQTQKRNEESQNTTTIEVKKTYIIRNQTQWAKQTT